MSRDWLWELEAQGVAWRLRGVGKDLVLVLPNRVQPMSSSAAVAMLQSLAARHPGAAEGVRRMGAELGAKGGASASRDAPSGAGRSATASPPGAKAGAGGGQADEDDALRAIGDALARGDLVAIQVRNPAVITDAELQMLEELRRRRSIPAPPLPPPPPPPPETDVPPVLRRRPCPRAMPNGSTVFNATTIRAAAWSEKPPLERDSAPWGERRSQAQ